MALARRGLEELHQAWTGSGLARFWPTIPKQIAVTSVDPTEAHKTGIASLQSA
jgi:hypothetical protein